MATAPLSQSASTDTGSVATTGPAGAAAYPSSEDWNVSPSVERGLAC